MKEILVTGGNGQLGRELKRHRWPEGWSIVPVDIDELDLRDPSAIRAMIASREWAAVINSAAYTAVDKAEQEVVNAWTVNALAPAIFAEACRAAAIPVIQMSTDYVFDGSREGPWEVDDPVAPLSVYGASKLAGELAVRTCCPHHVIIRTAWLVSAHGANFVKTMLRLAQTNSTVRVVADQWGSPTAAGDLAAALAMITIRLVDDPNSPRGTYHFSNAGAVTWANFAREVFAKSASRNGPSAVVEPIRTEDFPTAAKRPGNSLLSHQAIERDFGIVPREWKVALDGILDELLGEKM